MDVKTTFLHGDLEEEIYMKELECFVVKGKKELVCKIKKSLYVLNQSPRMYQNFDAYILGLGFVRSRDNHYLYSKQFGNHLIYVVLYVDDMLLVGNNLDFIKEISHMHKENHFQKVYIAKDKVTWFKQRMVELQNPMQSINFCHGKLQTWDWINLEPFISHRSTVKIKGLGPDT
jgi:hypothetical protein